MPSSFQLPGSPACFHSINIIHIDKESKTAVYKQIAFSLTSAIRNGTLKAGAPLPGSRELAKTVGVHRKTVTAAYEELNAQDWITLIPRKHVLVSERIPLLAPQKWNAPAVSTPYGNKLLLPFKKVEDTVKKYDEPPLPELIIDDGHPDVRLSPIDELLKTYRSYTSKKHSIKNAHIGAAQGTLKLREELARYLAETRGINVSGQNLLITHGAQMSIYLAAQLLLNNDSHIVVGKPNYPVANQTFAETGANLLEVNVDKNGLDTDALEALCRNKKIDAVYVIPHHHYPTTVTLSVERRMKLLELSVQHSFVLIEDDYDYDYHYTSSPDLPLASSGHNGNVLYIGSFSKILDPSLRIGFMVAAQNFIEQCVALRKLIDVGGDGYMQNALAALIRNGELKRHLKKAKKIYYQRRDFLNALLNDKLGAYVYFSLPSGGMAIWVKVLPEYPVGRLEENPRLQILRADREQNAFRVGFASMNESELEQAVSILQHSFESMHKTGLHT